MSVLTLNVDEVMRTLSAESSNPFVVHDKEVDIVRFAINSGFADIVLDGQVALRVMYQRPGETEVRAQTLTYYDTDGLRSYYDWQLLSADLAKKGTLTVALCILDISGGEVSEWHTTPCAVRVLSTIHTDDSDEGDDTITPTVKERVAVLESMIQRVASGAPIVVSSTSAMTDTDQIYVLSTNGRWYYHNGATWTAGGEYGAVATDTTLTQSGIPADAEAVGDAIASIVPGLSDEAKTALLACFEHVAWTDEHGRDYVDALENALYPETGLVSISAVFDSGSNVIYDTTPLNDLKAYLTVTGHYNDGKTKAIMDYTLSGTLTVGTSVITVSVEGKTTTFSVVVNEYWAVDWSYTDGMPQDNGFEIYNNAGTVEMTNNGVLVTAENATDKSYRYLRRYPDKTSLFTKDISEIKFVLDHFGAYNTAPYTNGIRLSPGSGVRGGESLPMPAYSFNNSGVTVWHPTSGNQYNHEVLAPYTFTAGVEYTIKVETTRTDSKVYINDVLVATDTVDKYNEERSGTYFGVSRGASIILKSFRENKEV